MTDALNDTGARTEFAGGGVLDTSEGKPRFDLLWPEGVPIDAQFLTRMAHVLMLGAAKYDERNWELFHTPEAVAHAQASLGRHYAGFMSGDTSEDHLAMMGCNLLILATLEWKVANGWTPPGDKAPALENLASKPRLVKRERRRRLQDFERATRDTPIDAAVVTSEAWARATLPQTAPGPAQGVPTTPPWTTPRNDGKPHEPGCRWTQPRHPRGCLDNPHVTEEALAALRELSKLKDGENFSGQLFTAAEPALRAGGVGPGEVLTARVIQRALLALVVPDSCDNPGWHTRRGCRCFGG